MLVEANGAVNRYVRVLGEVLGAEVLPLTDATIERFAQSSVGLDKILIDLTKDGQQFHLRVAHFERRHLASEANKWRNVQSHDGTPYSIVGEPRDSSRRFLLQLPERELDVQSVDGRLFRRDDACKAGLTDLTALLIYNFWRDEVVFQSEAALTAYRFLLTRFLNLTQVAEMIARFKHGGIVPSLPDDWVEREDRPQSDYQRVAVLCALSAGTFAEFMDRGTGKTAVAIQLVSMLAMRCRRDEGRMLNVLVVCPGQVVTNWTHEFKKFAAVSGKIVRMRGDKVERLSRMTSAISEETDCSYGAAVISYESASASIDHLCLVPWDIVVADESHKFKSSSTDRWKTMLKLRENSKRRLILTGTPIGNHMVDLWSQLEFLDRGLSGFGRFAAFRLFHGVVDKRLESTSGISRLIGARNVPLLQERLARVSFCLTKKEAGLNLPEKTHDIEDVELTQYQRELYRKLRDELIIEIGNDYLVVENVLTKLLRLSQITSGFIVWPEQRDEFGFVLREKRLERIKGSNPKLEALERILREEILDPETRDDGSKKILWSNYREDIARMEEVCLCLGIGCVRYDGTISKAERDAREQAFNQDPSVRVFIGTQSAGGEGLNLLGYDPTSPNPTDTYCDHEVFMAQNWSSLQRQQAEDRAHRRGTRMPVRITTLCAVDTVDEDIHDRVTTCAAEASNVTDLRAILKSVLGIAV